MATRTSHKADPYLTFNTVTAGRGAGGRPGAPRPPKKESGHEQPGGLQAVARPGRGLSLPEIRRLLWLRVPAPARAILAWADWRRRHQWLAQGCHARRQHLKLLQVQL